MYFYKFTNVDDSKWLLGMISPVGCGRRSLRVSLYPELAF